MDLKVGVLDAEYRHGLLFDVRIQHKTRCNPRKNMTAIVNFLSHLRLCCITSNPYMPSAVWCHDFSE